jgi:mono/diheme cytochrome c family protein
MPGLASSSRVLSSVLPILIIAACTPAGAPVSTTGDVSVAQGSQAQVLLGRRLVLTHACGDCHGGGNNPAAMGWLAGTKGPDQEFKIGPCYVTPGAQPCFTTRPKNITPDSTTGIGRYSERQIFNALRYGLRPEETPDVQIASAAPGQGNFPANPHYLAPPMPWPGWRHMTDQELWAIAAYLKRGVKPVTNKVADSERPPDFWASAYTVAEIGPDPAVAYPTANEQSVAQAALAQVTRGRSLVISHDCGGCHGGGSDPSAKGWLAGVMNPLQEFKIGPCYVTPGAQPCWTTRPKNLTPDNVTGMGRFSERQIFNSLRYGLRPEETADVEITSATPGQGNFPANPHYLAPPMPWGSWRHMSDEELWAIAAYLKRGVKPVSNKVADSEGPPDFWASAYTVAAFGPHPAAPYPTANER